MTTFLLNQGIEDGVVVVDEYSEFLALKLYKQAALVFSEDKERLEEEGNCSLNVHLYCLFVLNMTSLLDSCKLRFVESDLASVMEELVLSQHAIDHMSTQLNA